MITPEMSLYNKLAVEEHEATLAWQSADDAWFAVNIAGGNEHEIEAARVVTEAAQGTMNQAHETVRNHVRISTLQAAQDTGIPVSRRQWEKAQPKWQPNQVADFGNQPLRATGLLAAARVLFTHTRKGPELY